MSLRRAAATVFALIGLAGPAFAQPLLEQYTPPKAPAPPDPLSLLLRLGGLLALTLFICGGVIFWARRLNRVSGADALGSERLRIQSSVAVDTRCAVHLVDVDGQTVAVTTDATGVRSMVLLSEPMNPDDGDADDPLPAAKAITG